MSAGISNGACVQPSFSRAPLISSAPSGEPCADALPALLGAPKPMVVLQAIITGRSEACAFSSAAAMAAGSCPSMREGVPAGGLEALHLIDAVGERQRAVDGNAVVVEQHDQPVELQMSGERDGFLADAFHQVAVGGEHVGLVIDESAPNSAARCRSAIAMPTALARPCPSGPVVVSTPGVWPYSGWPAVFEPSWRKRLICVERHRRIAGEIEQRVEQHRAVAGRQHEAVAVGPGRIGRIEFQELREQDGGDVGGAHRQAGMAGFRLLDRVHRQRADGVGHARMGDGGNRRPLARGARGTTAAVGEAFALMEKACLRGWIACEALESM